MIKSNPYQSILATHSTGKSLSSQVQTERKSTALISHLHSGCHFIAVALFILIACSIGFAAGQQNSIAGHWEGAIKLPAGDLKFSADFTDVAGKLSATITIPQQGAKDLPLSDVAFDNDPNKREVSFALASDPGDPKING